VGACKKELLPNCEDRAKRAKDWDAYEKKLAEARKKRMDKELEDEEKKRKEMKTALEKCDETEDKIVKKRNEEADKFLKSLSFMQEKTTTAAPDGRRSLEESAESESGAVDCGITAPEGGDEGGTEAPPQTAVGFRHKKMTHLFERVQAAVAADLLAKRDKPSVFQVNERGLLNEHNTVQERERERAVRKKHMSLRERGELYEREARDGRLETGLGSRLRHAQRSKEVAVKQQEPRRDERVSDDDEEMRMGWEDNSNYRRGEEYEFKEVGRASSSDGRETMDPGARERLRYIRSRMAQRGRANLKPERGGDNSGLNAYDDDDDEEPDEAAVQARRKKEEEDKHKWDGPGDGNGDQYVDDEEDEEDLEDGRDDYNQPIHDDDFDRDPVD